MSVEVPAVRTRGTRYGEDVKALAWEVYAYRCGGDMPATLKLLGELVEPPLSEKTVYEWRDSLKWRERLAAEKQAAAPELWSRYFRELVVAAPEAVSYLRSVISNPDASAKDRISASRAVLTQVVQHIEQLEGIIDGAGGHTVAANLEGMTDAELRDYAEQVRGKKPE